MTAVGLSAAARFQVEQALQDVVLQSPLAAALTQEQTLKLRQTLDDTSARLMRTIISCLAMPEDDRSLQPSKLAQSAARQYLSPYVKPLLALPVDSEVLDLQAQVAAACQRVALLRATVPNQLAQQLTEHLQQCRPASDTPEKDQHALLDIDAHTVSTALADHSAAEAAASPTRSAARDSQRLVPGLHTDAIITTPLSPAPADLQNMYTAAVQRMPALRAKLEEALERMDRVVMAIERDGAQPSPYTSDLAVQAKHVQLMDNDAADDLSPALQQALQSGKVVARRQLTKDVNPVPYGA